MEYLNFALLLAVLVVLFAVATIQVRTYELLLSREPAPATPKAPPSGLVEVPSPRPNG